MNCDICKKEVKETYKLPNRSMICPSCLYKRHIELLNSFEKLLLDFMDYFSQQLDKYKSKL